MITKNHPKVKKPSNITKSNQLKQKKKILKIQSFKLRQNNRIQLK